ncbi:uncharacterized protein DZIP1 [Panulirus ornatus]|uniref:uncharacterized protein DZIP1 n=1 Tax=Panulirus ornatus TaxID=150431 RepID=UPI003A89DF47
MKTRLGAMSPTGAVAIPSAVEFPSQRRERVDWHKLASVDLHELSSGCSMEVLQENLSHVTFCDVESEFDVRTSAGQRNLLKMFRLAQLIIQYLFLSQEFLETQLQESQEEVLQITEKYQQVKAKLVEQVEEAKKMKITNKNMRETVKCINSFALANGIFQSLKCPLCPKTFRGQDFLQSHLWRKHPTQASSVPIPQVTQMPSAVSGSFVGPTMNSEAKNHEQPHSLVTPLQSAPTGISSKTNDVDSFRLAEIEQKFSMMNENFLKIMKEMEEQKRSLETENERRLEEVKKAWEEKDDMEKSYKSHLEKLSEQIANFQKGDRNTVPSFDREGFAEVIKKQAEELKFLQAQIQNQTENNRVEERSEDVVDGLSNELQALKKQLSEQKKNHKHSLKQIQESLQSDYEEKLKFEKIKLREMMKDIAQQEASIAIISQKPPPSPRTPTRRKPPVLNKATKPSSMIHELPGTSPISEHSDSRIESNIHHMDTCDSDTESESESETDTSHWNQSNLKVKRFQIRSSNTEKEEETQEQKMQKENNFHSEHSSSDSSEDDKSLCEDDRSSESLNLETLLKDNPQLWNQMREATSDVLASKLSSLGISPSTTGIKSEILTSCLSHLRKERRKFEEKYNNFLDLRKRLENEIRAKVDDKIYNAEDISEIQPLSEMLNGNKSKGKQSGVLSRVVKNVRSRVKEQSRVLSSTVSKTSESMKLGVKDMFHSSNKSNDDVKVISGTRRISSVSQEKAESEVDSSTETESEESSSAQIEIHNETSKSVTRNLFRDEPLTMESGARPKQGNYFDNKTYGQVEESESDWDSEPEYENCKKEPPKRTDSLNISAESADLHIISGNSWNPSETKQIKLKKASGEMVSNLTRSIELQLSGRKKNKPAGAVDVMGGTTVPGTSHEGGGILGYSNTDQSSPCGSQQHLQSVSDSSNTVPTSLWGSVSASEGGHHRESKATTGKMKATVHSWDSEDDLDISEIE